MKLLSIPLFLHSVPAGFPSPADDYMERSLDLNIYLIKHPAATYMARARGDSMEGSGIYDGDLLIVDRSLEAQQGQIIIAAIDGQLTCKILDKQNRCLRAANNNYSPIKLSEFSELIIEGVVIHSIRHHITPQS
ncbi:LexA family protein [sulfur-oxidizing endosymbiont of Gigantopelta aegis]|uniref:LexA family protein n=1 Tax=sulfur-oxidizing endosymbiont of Gigantopelta aegis TaxID=2794934 RepID=UPI0018DE4AE1|nr:translesion error-prone DNA polymerase V autoproteolytic subunit [sulfur-oxidizing endosymbiont of Gigantopelta aegis]